ncbi:MAG TPA: replicative DNA helicase [Deltaproteobacteria bacterium]|jgi:replicative DNA helicase|nr:replicative DNA helicase [Deltaproteobacteria bacterium]HRW80255.1 replicative DNA helicase [Desulfomonilia bacterium]NMD40615.1 replicative DNA helicase [Deltaproteobacteria bacterium]HNQ85429.1 replicative DNA helicase [Deltaproteobacteria bacterium]HNS89685.1 replicative DNA helicase [Deltaproteobacteria bacterium]
MDTPAVSLPHSREAEEYILGGILMENSSLDAVTEILSPEDFYAERNRILFEEMLRLMDKGLPIDLVSLTEAIEQKGRLDKIGGASYISQLADNIPTTANIEYYARLVRDKSILRSLITGAGDIIRTARTPSGEVSEVLETAEQIIYAINKQVKDKKGGLMRIGIPLQDLYHNLSRMAKGEVDQGIVPTGFGDLDTQLLGGLHKSDLIIVAGRPSMGKTSLAMNIAQYVTVVEQFPVAVFSLEMGIDQLALRMLACEAWINQSYVRSASSLTMLKEEDWSKLLEASGKLNDSPLYIDDTPGISPVEIRAKIRRLVSQVDVRLVVVDYLQLMTLRTRTDSREQEISEISRTLKAIAKEFNIPVIAISQLNRRVEERGDKRPMMSDLRESGAIEQDADVICFIYRDDVYNPDSAEKGIAEIIIAKHRNGPTGTIKLKWLPEYTKFWELDLQH